jgi:hypothetical protein
MMTEYFEISGIFLQLIWRVLTILTEHFEIGGIFQRVFVLTRRSFPTIFRQLSDNKSKSKAALPGHDPLSSRITTWYSTTAPTPFMSLVGRHCCVFLRQYSVHLGQYCVFLRQYCVKLRQYCVFLRQYSVHLRQDCVFLRQNCVNFRRFCVFLRQNSVVKTVFFFVSIVLNLVNTVFSSSVLC